MLNIADTVRVNRDVAFMKIDNVREIGFLILNR